MNSIYNRYLMKVRNYCGVVFGLISVASTFVSWDDIGISNLCIKLLILFTLIICILFISSLVISYSSKDEVFCRGNSSITVEFGDLLKDAFKTRWRWFASSNERIIVIPVNTHFDTIVEDATIPNPLVSINTIHGRWLKKYAEEMNLTPAEIQQKIHDFLDQKSVPYDIDSNRRRGNIRKYKQGTCAILNGLQNTNFVLLALSSFDENNNAQATKQQIIESLYSLIKFINQQLQGVDCYIPLMGTGRSRAGLTHKDSLHITLSLLDLYNDLIYSSIKVVIYKGDKSKVSIYDR